ncbi:ubiquitin carboxyl-terminal hydrolase 35-like isoform X2 [Gigantopelta aegis]|nr:ubiquitin carboxyl-terminal hydrolase 35-like isoform X2 [Gigantopelta aegis]
MDRILQGIIISNHPDPMKRQLIEKIAQKGQEKHPPNVVRSVLEICADWFLDGTCELTVASGLQVYLQWSQHDVSTLETFFDREFLLNLLEKKYRNMANVPILLQESLRLLQKTATFQSHVQVIQAKAIKYMEDHVEMKCLRNFTMFLEEFRDCIPSGDFTSRFCIAIINALAHCSVPEDENCILQFVQDANAVAEFLHKIWSNMDRSVILDSLRAIFTLISLEDEVESSFCLGVLVRYIPMEIANEVVENAVTDPVVEDTSITLALQKMIDWLAWPTVKNIDKWVIAFLKELALAKKYSVLTTVTEEKIDLVVEKFRYPVAREASFNIMSYMLLSFQHSPDPFHKILRDVPDLIKLLKEDTEDSKHHLEKFVELLHCLMQLHTGFPDLYDPVFEAIKEFPVPSGSTIKEKLAESSWHTNSSRDFSSHISVSEKSETGKTGLFNLGNTCYMNSVLQALFMCNRFQERVLTQTSLLNQELMNRLQETFAFLKLSQRPSFSAVSFLQASRPPWFTAGFQQDCSEFLKYLLDQLHEQEKQSRKKALKSSSKTKLGKKSKDEKGLKDQSDESSTLVQKTYGGQICSTLKCLNCKTESSRTECFYDIPLAFPEYEQTSHKSLAGGNAKDHHFERNVTIQESSVDDEVSVSAIPETSLRLDSLISHFLQPEKLTDDNKYHCDKCRGLQEGERMMKITRSPEYLILTLLRFSFDTKSQTRSKIFREVKYPKTLILPSENSTNADPKLPQSKKQRILPPKLLQKLYISEENSSGDKDIYSLCAVVVHSGTSSECGHYYCYARHTLLKSIQTVCEEVDRSESQEVDFLKDRWYLFNDSRVSFADYTSFSTVTKRFRKDTPYVLIYHKIDLDSTQVAGIAFSQCVSSTSVDHPIRHELRVAISKDNALYLQEEEQAAKAKAERRKRTSSISSTISQYTSNWHGDDDDDDHQGPMGGSCGGGGGLSNLDTSGSRFVF